MKSRVYKDQLGSKGKMTDKKFKLIVEYDGTDFYGWQRQPKFRTVQGEIEDVLERILGEKVIVYGAGRTDRGVHASGQVCHFSSTTKLEPRQLRGALAANLSEDVGVRGIWEVARDFHARFDALERRYSYFIRTSYSALWRRYFHFIDYEPDLPAMREAAGHLLGERDFSSFTPEAEKEKPTVCRLNSLSIFRKGKVIIFNLSADHFLYKMVRTMVGTLLEVGRGRITPEHIAEIIGRKDRRASGPTLPAKGLFLTEVVYHQ